MQNYDITNALFSIGMSPRLQLEQWYEHELQHSRKAHNPHKTGFFCYMIWRSVEKSINYQIVVAKSNVRPRKFDIFNLKKIICKIS